MKAIVGDDINKFRTAALAKALEVEINTGLRHSKLNILQIARAHLKTFGVEPSRTKKDVAQQLRELIDSE